VLPGLHPQGASAIEHTGPFRLERKEHRYRLAVPAVEARKNGGFLDWVRVRRPVEASKQA
jgi:hypothetical protein